MDGKAIGARIATLRKRTGITQQRLAEVVGVSVETVSRMERGTSFPSINSVENVARALGVELRDLFTFNDPPSEHDLLIDEIVGLLRSRPVGEVRTIRDTVARLLDGFSTVKNS